MRALVIRKGHLDEILARRKTWEIRGSSTTVREKIGLIESKSGLIVGICRLVDCKGPLKLTDMIKNCRKHGGTPSELRRDGLYYPRTHAWVLKDARRLRKPIPYKHPNGAIIWIKLDGTAAGRKLRSVI